MIEEGKTARQLFAALQAAPTRRRFGFGSRAALINVDLQCAYTQPASYVTAYETDPRQIEHVNALVQRGLGLGPAERRRLHPRDTDPHVARTLANEHADQREGGSRRGIGALVNGKLAA